MNIILCGSDGTFKTTIANKLSKQFGFPVVKGSSFEHARGTKGELYEFCSSVIDTDETQIVDRYIYSNLTYSTLYPEYTRLSDKHVEKLERKLIGSNSVVIYLTASVDTIISRIEERGDEHITTDRIGDIIREYNKVMTNAVHSNVRVYTFDTGILSSDEIVKQITELLSLESKEEINLSCARCKAELGEQSRQYLSETHCFNCYLYIMEDLYVRYEHIKPLENGDSFNG